MYSHDAPWQNQRYVLIHSKAQSCCLCQSQREVKAKLFIYGELEINYCLRAVWPSKNPAWLLTSCVARIALYMNGWLEPNSIRLMIWCTDKRQFVLRLSDRISKNYIFDWHEAVEIVRIKILGESIIKFDMFYSFNNGPYLPAIHHTKLFFSDLCTWN